MIANCCPQMLFGRWPETSVPQEPPSTFHYTAPGSLEVKCSKGETKEYPGWKPWSSIIATETMCCYSCHILLIRAESISPAQHKGNRYHQGPNTGIKITGAISEAAYNIPRGWYFSGSPLLPLSPYSYLHKHLMLSLEMEVMRANPTSGPHLFPPCSSHA